MDRTRDCQPYLFRSFALLALFVGLPTSGCALERSADSAGDVTPDAGSDGVSGDAVGIDAAEVDAPARRCNGHAELCGRRLSAISFAGTHNAMSNAEQGFIAPNQNFPIARQLEDGIRAMLIDTYLEDGTLLLCHGSCAFGSSDAVAEFGSITRFLEANPNEVLILILQDGTELDQTQALLDQSGLGSYLISPPEPGGAWPTLAELIDADTRVFVTLESGRGDDPKIVDVWEHFFETPYAFETRDDFSCEPNRGDDQNPLFLLNHWLGRPLPLPDLADEANDYDVLHARAVECAAVRGQNPTIVAVDFYDIGDLFEVVDVLNGVAPAR